MGSEREEQVAALIAAWNWRNYDAFFAGLRDDVEFVPDPRWPEPGPYRGETAVKFIRDWIEAWDHVELVIHELETIDSRVVARCTWDVEGSASGAAVTLDLSFVFVLDDELRLRRIHALFEHDHALEVARAPG